MFFERLTRTLPVAFTLVVCLSARVTAADKVPPEHVQFFENDVRPLLACERKWKQHGEGGLWISDWLPHVAECVADLGVIRSCVANGINHSAGVCQMNTCSISSGRWAVG